LLFGPKSEKFFFHHPLEVRFRFGRKLGKFSSLYSYLEVGDAI